MVVIDMRVAGSDGAGVEVTGVAKLLVVDVRASKVVEMAAIIILGNGKPDIEEIFI